MGVSVPAFHKVVKSRPLPHAYAGLDSGRTRPSPVRTGLFRVSWDSVIRMPDRGVGLERGTKRGSMRFHGVVPLLVIAVAACSSASTDPTATGTGGPSGAPTGTPSTPGTPKPDPTNDTKRPPPPVDPTNDPAAKACTGAPGSIYAVNVTKLDATDSIPLCRFQGSVLMVVNVASACGNTPQYAPLQKLYDTYRAQGFYILGFPCNQFGAQESGTEKEISQFCTSNYGITFPMFTKGNVNPPDVQPLYQWIHAQPGMATDVAWNFEKFLISRTGQIVQRIPDGTQPDDPAVVTAIEKELAKK